jgi:serine/threonine protein kinase
MTPERWQKIEQLYHSTLEREENQRAAFLCEVCAGDAALQREVESLLAQDSQADSFLESPAIDVAARAIAMHPSKSLIGRQLGAYKIVSLLGAGGMGEVYQAHDTKLGREVAIKVLPAAFVGDPERLARFQREARMLASLNHPNIATIHGLEHSDETHYLVMELVPGQTLDERLRVGVLKIEEALKVAVQIAQALETAHEKGVIHRDLKPANVKVTPEGRVKLLDFGLAKAFSGGAAQVLSNAATLTAMGTEEGMILGTPAYMSPEQARGKPVDKRTDIWAFGCVLYELLTARQVFGGETLTDTLAAVIERQPNWQALPPATPAKIQVLLQRCLQKDPQRRLRDLGDARIEIHEALAGHESAAEKILPVRSRWRGTAPWVTFATATMLVLTTTLIAFNFSGWRGRLFDDPASPHITSLAVLPLANLSGDPEQEYFADGMTDELTTDLAQIGGLRVISRTSAMQYKKTSKPFAEIVKELKVDGIVEGSVERAGGRVRIRAQLIDASNDRHLWAQSYERELRDVLSMQDEVARTVAREIQVNLTKQQEARLAKSSPVDPAAHDAYLLGRYHLEKWSSDGAKQAEKYFLQAIAKDRTYAPAYASLADTYMYGVPGLRPEELSAKAREAAREAIDLNENLGEAHVPLGEVKFRMEWDFPGAEKEFKRAIELNPNYARAHHSYSHYLIAMGRFDDSLAQSNLYLELDPAAPRSHQLIRLA